MTFLFFLGKVERNVSLVDLAEIDPYIEILPKFYTHILSSYGLPVIHFSKCQNCILYFTSFNINSIYVQTKEYI